MTQILNILKWPNEKLHQKCEDVVVFDDALDALGQSLLVTMKQKNGVGLAAPQVGVLLNVIAIWTDPLKPLVLVNPKTSSFGSEQFEVNEGCLSVPGYFEKRKRPGTIEILYNDIKGNEIRQTFTGLTAFCILHEIDHLNGKLFIDGASQLKKDIIKRKIAKVSR
jgi:peptide deformylase